MTIETLLPIPDVFAARRILCVQPHYDDNDIAAAGLLTELARHGAELLYLTVTNDLMGVVDPSLLDEAAAAGLKADQVAAGRIVGVREHYWLGYPDAGAYDYFAVRRDLLTHIRRLRPDFVFAPDPWLTYEGHRDHIQTGLAATEAVMFCGLTKIASSDPVVDAAYTGHDLRGIAYYFTREPNRIIDITSTWAAKRDALRCYGMQFTPDDMQSLLGAMEAKARQVALDQPFAYGEPFKVLPTGALHCAL